MNKEKLEQLNALTKIMIVSFLWHGSGLMKSSQPTETEQNPTKQSQTDEKNYPNQK
ncbi:MAG: hypothetical protein F6K48_06285 [Okeania sp. SIO3H1]|uniref:hypothetical protein n=1 Tax=Okeania sp. SIO1I7 TaxID=2607772 RepID=UPI0013CCE848|nr:hypothetical protein [Okeania sp. SIO1I7]NEN88555.1 hypothetical protein [Okeania sp. SIO3H1]NET28183.1 hypothetical protein [Okeania sp. SIO1I7]